MTDDNRCPECLRGFPLISEEGMAVLLTAERKATVENIRAMVRADSVFSPSLAEARVRLDTILDAEAAR